MGDVALAAIAGAIPAIFYGGSIGAFMLDHLFNSGLDVALVLVGVLLGRLPRTRG